MRNAARQLAERLEAVGTDQFLRGEAHFTRITEDDNGAGGPAGGVEHGAGAEDHRLGRGRAGIEGKFAVEGQGLAGSEHPGDRAFPRLAALQVDEAEYLPGVLAETLREGAGQESLGLAVKENDLPGRIGEQHAFLELRQQNGEMGGGEAKAGVGRSQGFWQRQRKADDPLQFLPA